MLTPHDVHHGHAEERLAQRAQVLAAAYAAHPERFPHGPPRPGTLPTAVWINKPVVDASVPENDLRECDRSDDREAGRDSSTPEFGAISSIGETTMLAETH
jgi:hypothetical protein